MLSVVMFKKLIEGAKIPEKQYSTDSGFDLYAASNEYLILPGEIKSISTGIAIDWRNQRYVNFEGIDFLLEFQVRSKSGKTYKKGLVVANTPGTIDCGYTGEIVALIHNISGKNQVIKAHEKVAQLVPSFVPVLSGEKPNYTTKRKDHGFGSTDKL